MRRTRDKIKRATKKDYLWIGLILLLILPLTNVIKFPRLEGYYTSTPMPEFTTEGWFLGEYQLLLEKHTGERTLLRNFLVRVNNQIDFYLYRESHAVKVIVGKCDYLYEIDYLKAYSGADFLGKDSIQSITKRLKFIQDTLKTKGIDLVVVFAAGKASFYPEYIPSEYLKNRKSNTNYSYFLEQFTQNGIAVIDFNRWFIQMKDTSKYPLYPKCGIHWSKYGEVLVTDSLIKYIEKLKKVSLPKIVIESIELDNEPRGSDDDVERGLNIIFNIEDFVMAYPNIRFEKTANSAKLSVLVVGDSYYKGMYDFGVSKEAFSNSDFWYYNEEIHNDTLQKHKDIGEIDLKSEIEKKDVIVLLTTESNLSRFSFGLINQLDSIYNLPSQ